MDNETLRWRYCQNCDVYPNCGECDVKKEIEKNKEGEVKANEN